MRGWARFVGKTVWLWLIGWPILAGTVWVGAPRIPTLLVDDETGFLPASMPSQKALAKRKEEFPQDAPASRVAIIFVRSEGLTQADREAMATVARALAARSEELRWRVHAAALAPYLKPILESDNGRAALIAVDLPAAMLTHNTVHRVRVLRHEVASLVHQPGLDIEVTGEAALGELLDANAKKDVDRTTLWAFVAVTTILLLIYRSPVAMLLPVVTIGLSLLTALGILGRAAAAGWAINGLVEMFIIVILAGTGVDYCLFLFARFREELAHCDAPPKAVELALGRTGGAILASAGTNAVALATLALARNRDLYSSGPTIAFAIALATFAVLTLTPSLMCVFGRWVLWPSSRRLHVPSDKTIWSVPARWTTSHPVLTSLFVLALLLPPAVFAFRIQPLFDSYEEYPPTSSFVRGARLYEEHFFAGHPVTEMTILVSADQRMDRTPAMPIVRKTIDDIAETLRAHFPVIYQRDLNRPLGVWSKPSESAARSLTDQLSAGLQDRLARGFYLGRSGKTMRIDIGLGVEPRSPAAMDMVPRVREAVTAVVQRSGLTLATGGSRAQVDLTGEAVLYADIRALRARDFFVIAVAAVVLVHSVLVVLLRSHTQAVILIAATLLTYLSTYGLTWLIVTQTLGVTSLSYQINFMLFIIVLSLGQDYNIYVVTRIRDELRVSQPAEAITTAVTRTGGVVSSCGLIMAAAFGSMYSGSLVVMKEFAIALALGILLDTFVVRPLLVPALMLLLLRRQAETKGCISELPHLPIR